MVNDARSDRAVLDQLLRIMLDLDVKHPGRGMLQLLDLLHQRAELSPQRRGEIEQLLATPVFRERKRRCVVVMRQRGGPTVSIRHVKLMPCRSPDDASPWEARFTPMKRAPGTTCMPGTRCGGSTTGAPNSVSIIISPVHIWTTIPAKRPGVRLRVAIRMAPSSGPLAAGHPRSPRWTGYWQRHQRKALDLAA